MLLNVDCNIDKMLLNVDGSCLLCAMYIDCRPAYSFVTSDVVEATCECLLATMEESSSIMNRTDAMTERLVLEEFGRCLLKVIESSNGMTGNYKYIKSLIHNIICVLLHHICWE